MSQQIIPFFKKNCRIYKPTNKQAIWLNWPCTLQLSLEASQLNTLLRTKEKHSLSITECSKILLWKISRRIETKQSTCNAINWLVSTRYESPPKMFIEHPRMQKQNSLQNKQVKLKNINFTLTTIMDIIFWDFLILYQIFFFTTSETKRDY